MLVLKIILLFIALAVLTIKRKSLTLTMLFVLVWFVFSLFNAYFSQRPYTHYLLVVLPSFMLLLGLIFAGRKRQKLLVVILIVSALFLYKDFQYFPLDKTVNYYGNFVQFATGQKNIREYRSFFDRRTPTYYDVAQYIKMHTQKNDPVFLWGNAAQVYTISETLPTGRFTVAYHIVGREGAIAETDKAIEKVKPKYIAVFGDVQVPGISLKQYNYKVTIDSVKVYERI